MSLIKCPECEKTISDRAVSCPNCGFPLSELDALEREKNTSTIDLLGEKVELPKGYLSYMIFHSKMEDEIDFLVEKYKEKSEKYFENVNWNLEGILEIGSNAISDFTDVCYSKLIEFGIYNVSQVGFSMEIQDESWNKRIHDIQKRQNEVVYKAYTKVKMREYRTKTRGRFIGGGFGIGGAIKGTFQAGMMNVAIGAVRNVGDSISNANTISKARDTRERILRNSRLTEFFISELEKSFRVMVEKTIDYIGELSNGELIARPLEEEVREANLILRNVRDITLPIQERKNVLLQVFSNNPFEMLLYVELLKYFPEKKQEIVCLIEALGIDVQDVFNEILNWSDELYPTNWEAEVLMDDYCNQYGNNDSVPSIVNLNNRIQYVTELHEIENKNVELINRVLKKMELNDLFPESFVVEYASQMNYSSEARKIFGLKINEDMSVGYEMICEANSYADVLDNLLVLNSVRTVSAHIFDVFEELSEKLYSFVNRDKSVTVEQLRLYEEKIVTLVDDMKAADEEGIYTTQIIESLDKYVEMFCKGLEQDIEEFEKELEKQKICSFCGEELDEGDIFCSNCGKRYEDG